MLARVSGNSGGIVSYLVDGMKSGREHTRDELDKRICIDGDLAVTDNIIKSINSDHSYDHITLSFKETDITEEEVKAVYTEYKEKLMSAYSDDEFNIYAEIHHPKIKSYENKKTGEKVERFPHIHIVIPNKNLASGNALHAFGKYSQNVKYFYAIQEHVNQKFNLSSPDDNHRDIQSQLDKSDIISRYKGDDFKGSNKVVKKEIYDLIHDKNIKNWKEFESELKKFGDVSIGRRGSDNEYLQLKPEGATKNIRLKEPCFSKDYIEDRTLLNTKDKNLKIDTLVNEWTEVRSHEVKYIHSSTPTFRKKYFASSPEEREELLNERREQFERKHDIESERRENSNKLSTQLNINRRFTNIRNGLPSLPQRDVVNREEREDRNTESVLSDNENNYLGAEQPSKYNQVRRDRARSGGYGVVRSPAQQLLNNYKEDAKQFEEKELFAQIKKELRPSSLLKDLKESHGLIPENYKYFRAKDSSYRISTGSRNLNSSDFLTKHMGLSWEETKKILVNSFEKQISNKLEAREENSIIYSSKSIDNPYNVRNIHTINESIRVFNYLKRKEEFQGDDMATLSAIEKYKIIQKNELSSSNDSELSVKKSFDNEKERRDLAARIETLKMGDLVASKDKKKVQVVYKSSLDGEQAFVDKGDRITFSRIKSPKEEHVALGLSMAAEKFGEVRLTGSKDFKQTVLDIAVEKDLKITFKPSSIQKEFMELKREKQEAIEDNEIQDKQEVQQKQQVQRDSEKEQSIDDKTMTLKFRWNEDDKKYVVRIDGKKPGEVLDDKTIDKLKSNDIFLNKFSKEEIQSGNLPASKADGLTPSPFSIDKNGEKISSTVNANKKMTL